MFFTEYVFFYLIFSKTWYPYGKDPFFLEERYKVNAFYLVSVLFELQSTKNIIEKYWKMFFLLITNFKNCIDKTNTIHDEDSSFVSNYLV